MTILRLDPDEAARLRQAPLTYAEVGQTGGDALPSGYHHLTRSVLVGRGDLLFEEVARRIMSWRLQREAGLGVRADGERVEPGMVAVLRIGVGVLAVEAPVRVVEVTDGPSRRGFAYGTLPGHPESGEESFHAVRDPSGDVRVEIRAFSRPASLLTRLAGPAGRAVQTFVTARYLRAARLSARAATGDRRG